jgi:hypothetical protein
MSSGADGRVMEGRATLFRHQGEVSRVQEYPGASSQIRERGKAIKKKMFLIHESKDSIVG